LQGSEEDRNMSEEEKDILIAKRKYWTKLMKYNLVGTVLFLIYVFVILSYRLAERCEQTSFSDGTVMCNSVLISYLLLSLFLLGSWPLSLIMYGYQSFKIYKITKPKVLAKSSEMSLRSTQKHNGAMGEDEITRLKSIADLRDSGVLTDDEFQEQKSKILSETPSQTTDSPFSLAAWINTNLSLGKAAVVGIVVGVIILILIISLFSFFGGSVSARAYVEGTYASGYEMCWSGAFHDGDSIISISGCGTETFYCSDGDFCSINAQKDEDNSHELCVRIGSKEACTKAAYGIAQV
jgi:uncharacterized membrane protein YesL